MPPRRDEAIVLGYVARYNRLRRGTGQAVGRLWDRAAGLTDELADRFATAAANTVTAGQTATVHNLDGYLAAIGAELTGDRVGPLALDPRSAIGAAARNGTDPVEVYRRGIVSSRVAIAAGQSFAEAMAIGRDRVTSAAETDIALAQRLATVQALDSDDRIVGYRRVLTGRSCALCATASTQRYRRGDLMPIHNHCDCGIAPIYGERDPGHVINHRLVADLKAAGSGDTAYWRSRRVEIDTDGTVRLPDVTVHRHGELGPVLSETGEGFTGPGDIAA